MIPNQTEIIYQKMIPMIILRHASNDGYRMSTLNLLDDDVMNFLDPEINHGLIEEIVVDDWIHFDPVLPDPELNKILGELFKIYDKNDLKRESKTDE